LTPEKIEKMRTLRDQGHSDVSIAAEVGCNRKTVAIYLGSRQSAGRVSGRGKTDGHRHHRDCLPSITPATCGFSLEGKHLMARKPTNLWPARFRALQRGKGYTLQGLSSEWGASINTIREHAKTEGCIRWVELDGEFVECIVHPDTEGGK